jgi:ubiquinone/menaquinone biosynthesis C-methylase UbiE
MSEAQLFAARSFPEIYEGVLVGPLFRPFAEALLACVAPQPGDKVIDVACGTGIVARIARDRLGADAQVVGVDIAPTMLAVARKVDPSIDWRQGDATALPVRVDERFTVLTCHQGLQFMPDKPATVREMRRVLESRGRVAIATWCSLDQLPDVHALNAVVERHVGPIVDSRHSLGDADTLRTLLADGGFRDVRVETVTHDVRFVDGALYARLNAMAAIGMSDRGKSMSEAARAELAGQVASESQDLITKATRNRQFVLSLSTHVALAHAQ